MSGPALLVLAAGMGSRYGGLKQMDAVGPCGEAIVDYSIYDALRAGFRRVVFVLRKEIETEFRQKVGARFEHLVEVSYVLQDLQHVPAGFHVPAGRTKPWGTTHAVLAAEGTINGPFAVINADDFYGAESYRLLAEHLRNAAAEHALVGYVLRRTLSEYGAVARGVCAVDAHGLLRDVTEMTQIERVGTQIRNTLADGRATELTGDELVSMNLWGLRAEIFPLLRERLAAFLAAHGTELKSECYLPATVSELIGAGKAAVRVLPTPETWFGVTYQQDKPEVVASVRRLIEAGQYPERLWG
ncbi:MAG: NTP transferase domain-containing protein [Acidobacteriota bacterium]|nr:NTP transferase domain-containing protein [Acidobacteriota bacterium]